MMWEILVPTIFNDGRPIKAAYHRTWDAKVREIAGGLTILKPAKGQWKSPDGTLFSERMIPVRILCDREQHAEIVRMTLDHYEQLAVMTYLVSTEAYIIAADETMKNKWVKQKKIGMRHYDWLGKE